MFKVPEGLKKGALDLSTCGGNAVGVIVKVQKALKKAGNDEKIVAAVRKEMQSGNYDHLLAVAAMVVEDD